MHVKAAFVTMIVAVSGALAPPLNAAAADKLIGVGTGAINGVYYPLGGAICRFVNAGRNDHGQRCMVESTDGSVANINAVIAGELDLGFAQSDAQYTAVKGLGPFKDHPQARLRVLFSVYPESFTVLARSDANIDAISDLQGKRIYVGDTGSALRLIAELVFNAYGVKPQAPEATAAIGSAAAASALCDKRIAAFALIAGHPNAMLRQAAGSCATHIVAVSGPAIDRLIAEYPFLGRASVPGGIYPGTDSAQPSFGVFATVVTSADLPEATAYLVTRAVFEHIDAFRLAHPALAHISKQSMLLGNTAPFHPGAIRYFKEAGLMK